MSLFIITTQESVQGTYEVEAPDEETARQKFSRRPERLIDWSGVTQIEYMAYEVEVEHVVS